MTLPLVTLEQKNYMNTNTLLYTKNFLEANGLLGCVFILCIFFFFFLKIAHSVNSLEKLNKDELI